MSKELVKQDINFLEYPIWFQDKNLAEQKENGYVWKDREDYIYRAGYKIPTKTDGIFLLYLILKSQQNCWTNELILTRYEILCKCNIKPNKRWYERLEDSFKRWKMVGIEFNGTFYDNKKYQIMNFGIIDDWDIEEKTTRLRIKLNSKWVTKIKESTYFKLIDFDIIKKLRSPLVIRLYEILIKIFQQRNIWEIDALKLANKVPMNEQYPAQIIPKIKAAVNRINNYSVLQLNLTVKRPKRGKAIFVFEKIIVNNKDKTTSTATIESSEDDTLESLIKLLPLKYQNSNALLNTIEDIYNKYGYDYTARNIKYTNRNCSQNYRVYLVKAFKEDWGEKIVEDLTAANKIIEQKLKNLQQEYKKYKESRFSNYISQLPAEEYKQELEHIIKHACKENPIIKDISKKIQHQIAEEILYNTWIEQGKIELQSFNEWREEVNR